MPTELKGLIGARALLAQFEVKMEHAECLPYLVDGLSLLADVRDESDSPIEQQVASNIALAYARKVGAAVQTLFARNRTSTGTLGGIGETFSPRLKRLDSSSHKLSRKFIRIS